MARTEREEPETEEPEEDSGQESGMDKLRGELSNFLSAQVSNLATKAGDKLTDVTSQLTNVSDNGGSLASIASRTLQGESPVKAFMSEKTKSVKDNAMDKVKGVFGGGGGDGDGGGGGKGKHKSSGGKFMDIVEILDVGVPLRTAYDFWSQYDQFSSFTKGVQDVSKEDETTSDWKVKIGPSNRSFKATVQEQVPDERIVWTSEGAKGTTRGSVSFHELTPTLTRIVLVVEYYPSGFFEKTGNLWRVQGRRIRLDFKNFQRYVSLTDEEPEEAWRGEIREGEVVKSHEEAMEEEEAEGNGDEEESEDEGEEPEDSEEEEGSDEDEEEGDEEYEDEDEEGDEEYGDEEEEDEPEEEEEEEEDEEPEEEDEEDEEEEPPAKKRRQKARRSQR